MKKGAMCLGISICSTYLYVYAWYVRYLLRQVGGTVGVVSRLSNDCLFVHLLERKAEEEKEYGLSRPEELKLLRLRLID